MTNKRYLRFLPWFGLALLLVFAMAATEPQGCAKVQDRTTGPAGTSLSPTHNGNGGGHLENDYVGCIHDCVLQAQTARDAEQALHKANVKACTGDPDCLGQENIRHDAVMEQIDTDLLACKASCHDQGSGQGGE